MHHYLFSTTRNITSIQEMGDRQIDIARGFLEAARIQETDTSQRLFVAIGAGVGIASVISSIGSALIKDINPSVSPINNLFVVLVYSIVFGLTLFCHFRQIIISKPYDSRLSQ